MFKRIFVFILCTFLFIFSSQSFFVLQQHNNAIVFQFGESVKVVNTPGYHLKIPFIQNVVLFDNRILDVNVKGKELTALDGKRIIVDIFCKFKISQPLVFFKTVHNYYGVKLRIGKILESSMRKIIGQVNLNTILTDKRNSLMLLIKDLVVQETKDFGIDIVDVRILKADLPTENSSAIYKRMQTERDKEAKQIRAEGNEQAAKIISKADKERSIIISNAHMYAQKIKSDGDESATRICSIAYAKNFSFFKFYRSLIAYQNLFAQDNTKFVLSPNLKFFKYFDID